MSSGDPRRGRRDNGLLASDYAAAGDVDPRVGEHLLDVLGLEGIAAYLRPATDLHPVTRTTSLPDRPTDRLYVDRQHLATARGYLTQLAADAAAAEEDEVSADDDPDRADPGRGASGRGASVLGAGGPGSSEESDLDRRWDAIVSGYHAEPEGRLWPAAEDVPDTGHSALVTGTGRDRGDPARPGPSAHPADRGARPESDPRLEGGSLLDGLDTFGAGLPDEDEGRFVPPTPPPLPRPTLPTVLGAAGLLGGLVVFLRPSLLPLDPTQAMLLGFAALISGFVTLVWRLRPGDEDDIDPDDGARV